MTMQHLKHGAWLFSGAMLYAVARYNIFGEVAWANVPAYVSNKALSWTGLVLFGLSLVSRDKADRRGYGTLAVAATGTHVLMSLLVLNPAYFAKFYGEGGRLNGIGEASMLAGVAGATLLGALFAANLNGGQSGASLRSGWGRAVLCCSALHVLIMGAAGWLTPAQWPGYFPPISLLSFLTAIYFLYRRQQRKT
jgi:hypothetical protein